MLVIAFLTFLLFLYIAYRRPVLALSALAALLPTYLLRLKIFGLPSTFLEVIIWAIFFGWLLHSSSPFAKGEARWGILKIRLQKIRWPLALFFIASVISVFAAPDFIKALGLWRAFFLEPGLVFLMILAVVPPTLLPLSKGEERGGGEKTEPRSECPWPSTTGVIFGLSVSALYVSAIAVGQKIFGLPNPFLENTARASSVFPQPNMLGLYLAPIIILMIGQIIKIQEYKNIKIKLLATGYWLLVILLSFLAIIAAKSDGAVVAVIGGAAVFLLLWNKKFFFPFLIVFMFLCFYVFMFPKNIFAEKIFFNDWSGFVRQNIWRESWAMLKDNWLQGAGISGYATKILPYHASREWMDVFQYPHNIIFNFWSELGILGLAAFLWLLEKFFKMCYKLFGSSLWKREGGRDLFAITATSAMSALLIHGLVDIPYFKNDLSILFWIIYALPFVI